MGRTVISVEELGKEYLVGCSEKSGDTFREMIVSAAAAPFRRLKRLSGKANPEERIWALKDVSFQVKEGEVVGIIGRNGAGKSTLLKILSRITAPTQGHVKMHGRVSSLLEVGTGFHPELTGRENIYLNGAILGMSHAEIGQKFDEIVEFSGVERFLDTPVKRYSSGMSVRLAFGVAAHLEPEILLVDEVLAVGDVEFQKKCLNKLGDLAGGGRTVVFVSHSMRAISHLCQRGIVLSSGTVTHDEGVQEAIRHYLAAGARESEGYIDLEACPPVTARGNQEAVFTSFRLRNSIGQTTAQLGFGEAMTVEVSLESSRLLTGTVFGFSFVSADGRELQGTAAQDGGIESVIPAGRSGFECLIDPMILTPGTYYLRAAIYRPGILYHYIEEILRFEVLAISQHRRGAPSHNVVGDIYMPYQWRVASDKTEAVAIETPGTRAVK